MKSLSLTKPHLMILVGIPGSGKSFFAEKFAETFHTAFVQQEKIAEYAADPAGAKQLASMQLGQLLKTKQPIIFEGDTHTRAERLELAKAARAAGYDALTIWVQTDPATAKARALRDKATTLTNDTYDRAIARFTPPNNLENPVVVSGKHTYASQAKVVLLRLSSPRAEISRQIAAPARPERHGRQRIAIG